MNEICSNRKSKIRMGFNTTTKELSFSSILKKHLKMDSVISSTEVNKLKQYFIVLDADNDEKISKSDVKLIVRSIGIAGLDDDFDRVIAGMSSNPSSLSFEELLNIAISMKQGQTNEYDSVIQVFKMFDKNQDGTVLASDLRQIMSHLGEVIPEDEIDGLFRSLGYKETIDYEEFAKVLLSTD